MKNLFLVMLLVVFTGCSSKTPTPEITVFNKSISDFTVYIDRDDKVKFLCFSNHNLNNYKDDICHYYDEEKHSYKNLIVEEEVIGMDRLGFEPLYYPDESNTCGFGNLWGIYSLFGAENIWDNNTDECKYRYTKVAGIRLLDRVIILPFTFGTSLVLMGNMHIRTFDEDAFYASIRASGLGSYYKEFYTAIEGYSLEGGFDIIYLERGSVKSSLEGKYKELQSSKSKKAGVLFLDDDTRELLSIIIFDKYKEKNIMQALSANISDLVKDVSKDSQSMVTNQQIINQIPYEISLPTLPSIPSLTKGEYEKKTEFKERVKEAYSQREEHIAKLQEKYSKDVQERNDFIEELQLNYKEYLEKIHTNKVQLIEELNGSIPILAKVLFLENISGYGASEFNYDADSEQLFFTISSKRDYFSQKVVTEIPPSQARDIKEEARYKITPLIEYKHSTIELKGFEILNTYSDDSFEVSYTDINYKSEKISINIVKEDEKIDKELALAFSNAKQKVISLKDNNPKETWYRDSVNILNAKVPSWIATPQILDGSLMVTGSGDTLYLAKVEAVDALVLRLDVSVDTTIKSSSRSNNITTTQEISINSKHFSKVDLAAGDYDVYRQEYLDGKWYVALRYLK